MANYSAKNVDQYIEAAPAQSRPHLIKIRQAVESAIPSIEQEIGYGKPYYKYRGWVAGFDVYKNHVGFEVWGGLSSDDRKSLEEKGYKTGSVTFQIGYTQEVPAAIIRGLVKAQVKRNEEKFAKKKS